MAANLQDVLKGFLSTAQHEAGTGWANIKSAVQAETKVFGQRLVQIKNGYASGEFTKADAKDFFSMILNNMIATIAMVTTLVWATVQKIINAAIAAVKTLINSFMKFSLLPI